MNEETKNVPEEWQRWMEILDEVNRIKELEEESIKVNQLHRGTKE